MKNLIKKSLAVILAVLMISSCSTCFAAELNETAVNLHKGQFENYLLLGDSVACGYRDEITENDAAFNEANWETTYVRVPGSYADVLANAIIDDQSMTSFAGPGYRTIEMRYMLEDDYAANCTDEFLFWPSHLYVYEEKWGPEYAPGAEYWREKFQQAVADADLITLGVGGNDWGAYLGWVVNQILEEENVGDQYMQMLNEFMAENELDLGSVDQLVEIAHMAGALPALLEKVPEALAYGLGNFYTNWDIMIQDIYDLNPDVTLVVLGMSDNSLKGNYYDYDGVAGGPVNGEDTVVDDAGSATSALIDAVMSIGNKPMIDGAEKFGYIYVDTAGTTYVDSHPDAAGHVFIANKIIEALPDPEVSKMFDDVKPGHKYYNAVEYVILNGIMTSTADRTFAPDEKFTSGQLAAAFNAINGADNATGGTQTVSISNLAVEFIASGSANGGFMGFLNAFIHSFKLVVNNLTSINKPLTRGQAAEYIADFCKSM